MRRAALALGIALGIGTWLAAAPAGAAETSSPPLRVAAPLPGQLSLVGPVAVEVQLPASLAPGTLELRVDGAPVDTRGFERHGRTLRGALEGLGAGRHTLEASASGRSGAESLSSWFELVALENPDSCEVLNNASCLLPFPSSRFLAHAPTHTGYQVVYPPDAMPLFDRLQVPVDGTKLALDVPVDPTPFLQNDGFSPTVQVLMNFPQGVDVEGSDAPRLDPVARTYGTRGLEDSSPTLLVDWRGRRVNHWIENDARVRRNPARRVTFLRPGEALLPGHRYVVAVRKLVDASGAPVEAEPVFAAIRDRRPSTIPAVEAARRRLEPVLRRLAALGVARDELILAFDVVVSSDDSLTHEMLSMRDQAFAWLADQLAAGAQTFTVEQVIPRNESCDPAGPTVWREVRGTFQAPLFLSDDPFVHAKQPSFLQHDASGTPAWHSLTNAPYGIAIPCSARLAPKPALVIGHGLFGNGPDTVSDVTELASEAFDFVAGGTNWSGLSSPDVADLPDSFIVRVIADVDQFPALPDRLRQGQLQTLLLARMLKQGVFDQDPAFRVEGHGVIDVDAPAYYFGASLGGIMGTMFAALTPDVTKLNVDVPAINFSLLLQRATPFIEFQQLVGLINDSPMEQVIGYGLNHELWVRGEPAGYANHVTGRPLAPLPGSPPKQMLVTVAWLDQQVSNLGSQLLGRTLRLGTLEGSLQRGLPGMPDTTGPQDSAYVVYDTGSFDLDDPAHVPFIPPLENNPPVRNRCDPHPLRAVIPDSLAQLAAFLTPDGQIENFCADGVCDASEPDELPFGASVPCDPLD